MLSLRVLSLQSSVIHDFVTEPWHSRRVLFLCECVALSVLEPCALSFVCLVSCWSMVFGSWLVFWVSVSWRGSDTRTPCSVLLCECAVLSLLSRALFCPHVLCCCMQFTFLSAACFHAVISCVNTLLMSFLNSCVFVSCSCSIFLFCSLINRHHSCWVIRLFLVLRN